MSQKIKTSVEIDGSLSASQIANATIDTDKFLVSDGGTIKYRTGAELVQDLGIQPGETSKVQHQVKAGVAINKGQAVYVTGADGTNMIVGLASNTSEATSSKTMGLINATVAANGFADVITEGLLDGLNTIGANAGDPVWLGANGNLIYGLVNKPYAPLHLVFIGIVTRVNANNGEIFVKVQNGFELNEVHDVDLKTTIPVNGHVLGFDGTLWVNKTIAGWLGYIPADDNLVVHKAGTETITGEKTFSAIRTNVEGSLTLKSGSATRVLISSFNTNQVDFGVTPAGTTFTSKFIFPSASVNYTFPGSSGTIALTSDLAGYVPITRTITINGSTQDLSANRIFNIDTGVTSFNTRTGAVTLSSTDVTNALGYTPVTQARTITINGVTQDLSANRSFTVTAPETDTLATVTARGATTSTALNLNGNVTFFGQLAVENQGTFARLAFNRLTFWDWQGGNDIVTIDGGYLEAANSLRAPIFYDSNNTGYYLDPSSISYMNRIHLDHNTASGIANNSFNVSRSLLGNIHIVNGAGPSSGNGNQAAITFMGGTASESQAGIYVGNNNSAGTYMGFATTDSYAIGPQLFMTAANNGQVTFPRSFVQASGDFRAPIFYDSNDTAYYLDPSSTGLGLRLNGNIEVFARSASWAEGVRVRVPSTSTWGGFRVTRDRGNNDGNWYFGYVGFDSSDDFVFGAQNGGTQVDNILRLTKGGPVVAGYDLRAPIFYDSNDTGRYIDPNGTSQTNSMRASEFRGNANVGGTGEATWHPAGAYIGSTMWQYGAMYKNYTDIWDVSNVYCRGWFRNYGQQGIYNQDYGVHFYGTNSDGWALTGSGGNIQLQFRSNHGTGLRGYVYADTANNIGFLTSSGNWRLRCDDSGNAIATGDVTAYSDRRVKENIVTIEKPLDKVLSLRGVYYTRIDSEDKQRKIGVIAQETLEVLPEVVGQDTDGMYNVAYGNMVALLIEGMKEQQKQIEELKQLIKNK